MKVLVLGATGMLGYSLFSNLSELDAYDVFGTVRDSKKDKYFSDYQDKLLSYVHVEDIDSVKNAIKAIQPHVVINCVGIIKQLDVSKQNAPTIYINSLFPHLLADVCTENNAKLIHFSTDCVFSGSRGMYKDDEKSDCSDLYGKSKHLGEVYYSSHLTLRTSIIGHELYSNRSLVDWFLNQSQGIKGFEKAIFSGLPTVFIARLLAEYILPNRDLSGLYNLSVDPINKHDLLQLISRIYKKDIPIEKDLNFIIDRSLDSTRLVSEIGEFKLPWEQLITIMYSDYVKRYEK